MTQTAKTPKVESFNLDHTKVRAPYVRLAGRYATPKGDEVRKFDLRLVQPNRAEIPTAALHTIEHLMAGYLREGLPNIIDASPMGCRTGFYLTALGEPDEEAVRRALEHALKSRDHPHRPHPRLQRTRVRQLPRPFPPRRAGLGGAGAGKSHHHSGDGTLRQ